MDGSQGPYLSVSACKRPSCIIRGRGLCSGSLGSGVCWTGVSCCLGWDSSLLDSSDFGGTASFSTSANQSEVSLCWARTPIWDPQILAEGTGISVHCPGDVSLGGVHLVTSTPSPSWPGSSLVITPPASSIFVCHTSKGHTPAHRQAGSSTPLPTWAQQRQGYPYSTAEQRVQHEHPVWADLAPAENLLHLGREDGVAETAKPQLEVEFELERPRKSFA